MIQYFLCSRIMMSVYFFMFFWFLSTKFFFCTFFLKNALSFFYLDGSVVLL
jgi:hypothetical protein